MPIQSIIIVSHEVPPIGGGAGVVALEHARRLASTGCQVHLVTTAQTRRVSSEALSKDSSRINLYGVNVFRKSNSGTRLRELALFVLRGIPTVRRIHRLTGATIIHTHGLLPSALLSLAAPVSTRVVTVHGSDVPGFNRDRYRVPHAFLRPLARLLAAKLDAIVCPSPLMDNLVADLAPKSRRVTIPNGIELSTMPFVARPNPRTILVSARLERRKQVNLLLEALEFLNDPVVVHVMGDGPERPRLERLAEHLRGRHDVVFHGWVHRNSRQWRALYESAAISASLGSFENAPITALEALAAGHALVASDIEAHRTLRGPTSTLVDPNPASVASGLKKFLSRTPDEILADAGGSRSKIGENFAWERVIGQYLDLYTLVQQPRALPKRGGDRRQRTDLWRQ